MSEIGTPTYSLLCQNRHVHAPGEDGNSSVHLGLALALQIAQLAVIVAAPGKDPAFHRDGHPVVAAGGDMGDPVVMALLRGEDDLDGHRLAALVVFVATVVVEGQVGAQLAVEVVAPCLLYTSMWRMAWEASMVLGVSSTTAG